MSAVVVEDDDDVAEVLVRILRADGFEVERARSGGSALDEVRSRRPDVVLLDLGLPDMDGLDVCSRMRADGFSGCVIVVSARAGDGLLAAITAAGADDFIPKPFRISGLTQRVRACADQIGQG